MNFFKEKIEDLVNEQEFSAIAKTSIGKGSEAEQRLAIQTIALKICHLNDNSIDFQNPTVSNFNEGVRYVGRMLLKICQVESDYFEKIKQIKEKGFGFKEFVKNKNQKVRNLINNQTKL